MKKIHGLNPKTFTGFFCQVPLLLANLCVAFFPAAKMLP